jgi:hypothetical protein
VSQNRVKLAFLLLLESLLLPTSLPLLLSFCCWGVIIWSLTAWFMATFTATIFSQTSYFETTTFLESGRDEGRLAPLDSSQGQ